MCTEAEFAHDLNATRAATLVLGRLHDPLMPPDSLRLQVVARIPRARLALLDCDTTSLSRRRGKRRP